MNCAVHWQNVLKVLNETAPKNSDWRVPRALVELKRSFPIGSSVISGIVPEEKPSAQQQKHAADNKPELSQIAGPG